MQGRRRPDGTRPYELEPGEYTKMRISNSAGEEWDQWFMRTPDGQSEAFYLASVHQPDRNGRHHEVEEHEDGTISVTPRPGNGNSIKNHEGTWHGWIRHGVWEHV